MALAVVVPVEVEETQAGALTTQPHQVIVVGVDLFKLNIQTHTNNKQRINKVPYEFI
tara:strand:+ start:437 stop:607 length:171 start_codon:yes stop_codon:yes gene_type:complete